jgi:hypothetical protein
MRTKKQPPKLRISLMITPEQEFWVKRIATKKKLSQGSLIREAIDLLKDTKKYR